MRRQEHNGAYPHDPDTDRLGAVWNEITAGRIPSYEDGPTELIAAAELLHAEAPSSRLRPRFKTDLRETLMQTTLQVQAPAMAPLKRLNGGSIAVPPGLGARPGIPLTVRKTATRWMAIAATIALLPTTAVGAYFTGLYRADNDPGGTSIAAPNVVSTAGTPVAGGTPVADACAQYGPYLPCGADVFEAQALITNFPPEALTAQSVQLQGWEIDGEQRVTFSTEPANPVTGVGVDIVVSGAYRATFDGPTVVTRPVAGGANTFSYPEVGTVVELSRGDSVTYQLGTKNVVQNPLDITTLQFKSIVFYEGDPAPENLASDGDFRARVDGGEGADLPMPISEYDTVRLTYIQLIPGYPFPPEATDWATAVLGPVASTLVGGGPEQGFVVWVGNSLG